MNVIRPHIQNLEPGECSANSVRVTWDSMILTNVLKYMKLSVTSFTMQLSKSEKSYRTV
jgi:hypothetical protein